MQRFSGAFTLFGPNRRPMSIIHVLLIAANSIIIIGGSQLAGGLQSAQDFHNVITRAKAMRAAGQAIFLSVTVFLVYCIYDTIVQCKRDRSGKVHPTLWVLLAVWPLLFIRGVYGILSGLLPAFNYFSPTNYDEHGLKSAFVISEYILGTSMEWSACALLMFTYVTSRGDPRKVDLGQMNQVLKSKCQTA
jgi:hypothetical protein